MMNILPHLLKEGSWKRGKRKLGERERKKRRKGRKEGVKEKEEERGEIREDAPLSLNILVLIS